MIIGITGLMGSGKDTVAQMIMGLAPQYNWENKKFAGKLKEIASLLTGLPIEHFESQELKNLPLPSMWDIPESTKEEYGFIRPDGGGYGFMGLRTVVVPSRPMTKREFMQKLGTDACRDGLHVNTWVNSLWADYTDACNWLVTDMRFENEMKSVKDNGGLTLRISNPNCVAGTHTSETALLDAEMDYTIVNDGTLAGLQEKVRELLVSLKILGN